MHNYDDIERLLPESLNHVDADVSDRGSKNVAEYLDFGVNRSGFGGGFNS